MANIAVILLSPAGHEEFEMTATSIDEVLVYSEMRFALPKLQYGYGVAVNGKSVPPSYELVDSDVVCIAPNPSVD